MIIGSCRLVAPMMKRRVWRFGVLNTAQLDTVDSSLFFVFLFVRDLVFRILGRIGNYFAASFNVFAGAFNRVAGCETRDQQAKAELFFQICHKNSVQTWGVTSFKRRTRVLVPHDSPGT
jgi:hypothetical protein